LGIKSPEAVKACSLAYRKWLVWLLRDGSAQQLVFTEYLHSLVLLENDRCVAGWAHQIAK
jgi:hypothetical protein